MCSQQFMGVFLLFVSLTATAVCCCTVFFHPCCTKLSSTWKTFGPRRANWCAPRLTNMLLCRSLSLLLGSAACRNMSKYVGDATAGFIVTPVLAADGMCKARPLSDSWRCTKFPMSWNEVKVELARGVDEPPNEAVRLTYQKTWGCKRRPLLAPLPADVLTCQFAAFWFYVRIGDVDNW